MKKIILIFIISLISLNIYSEEINHEKLMCESIGGVYLYSSPYLSSKFDCINKEYAFTIVTIEDFKFKFSEAKDKAKKVSKKLGLLFKITNKQDIKKVKKLIEPLKSSQIKIIILYIFNNKATYEII